MSTIQKTGWWCAPFLAFGVFISQAQQVLGVPAAWSAGLENIVRLALEEVIKGGSGTIVDLFRGKLNEWLASENGNTTERLEGGEIVVTENGEVRSWALNGKFTP